MTNQIFLVGRLTNQPKMEEGVATNTCQYCKKGDLVGVRGKLQMNEKLEVIADKITFLSSNKDLINRED